MTRVRALIAGCMAAFAFVASAHAADPAGSWRRPPMESDYEKPGPQYLMSGWYLRGDVGYRWNGGGPSSSNVTSERYTTSFDGTVGFGYKYQWFRADLIYDRSGPTRVSATTTAATNQPQLTAKISSQTVLANGYIDFGTWAGFTPYVGAGVGIARLKSVDYVDTTDSPSNNVSGVTGQGTQQNFAWAAMAGVAYQITPSWVLDIGFRHLELGDVPSSNGAGVQTNAAVFKSQSTNEARIGIRYLLD
jgi:opacity protein-like surface antigen